MSETIEGVAEEQAPQEKKKSGTALRVLTVVPLIPIIIWMMFWGPRWTWHVFIFGAIGIGGFEMMGMMVSSRGLRWWGAASAVLFAYGVVFFQSLTALYGLTLALILAAMVWTLLQDDPIHNASARIGWLLATPVYVGGSLATMDLIRDFQPTGAWVLLAMMLAWGSDTSAYFVGRKFGKTKLAPRISPKKTLEGAVGGLAGAVFGSFILSFFIPALPWFDAIALALVGATAGQAGDLFESVLKRSSGVKDSGGILPGHGGILDRADALIFTSPAVWIYGTFVAGL